MQTLQIFTEGRNPHHCCYVPATIPHMQYERRKKTELSAKKRPKKFQVHRKANIVFHLNWSHEQPPTIDIVYSHILSLRIENQVQKSRSPK